MATRNDTVTAEEKAYAEASAAVPAASKPTPVVAEATPAPVAKAAAAPKPKTVVAPKAKAPAKPKTAPAKAVVAAKPKAAAPKAAPAKPVKIKAAAPKRVVAKKPSVTITAVASKPALLSKGQTMITEAATKFTEEATKVANQAKAQAETTFADIQTRAKAATEKSQEFAKDAVEFSKGNVEAIVESAKIAAKGFETVGQEFVAFTKQALTDTTEAAKRYSSVKTPTEFFQLQSELSKTALDSLVKHGAKTTELSVKLANDAFQPISNRIALAVSKLKSAA